VTLRRFGIWGLCHIQPMRYAALLLMTGQLGRKPKIAQKSPSARQ
jgi:hypothetical protein